MSNLVKPLGLLAALPVFGVVVYFAIAVVDHGRHDQTGAVVWTVAAVMEAAQPASADPAVLERVFNQTGHNAEYLSRDGWGNAVQVEVLSSKREDYHYRVVSYGRDGQPGPCLVLALGRKSPDADWVIEDGELQR